MKKTISVIGSIALFLSLAAYGQAGDRGQARGRNESPPPRLFEFSPAPIERDAVANAALAARSHAAVTWIGPGVANVALVRDRGETVLEGQPIKMP